MIWNQPTIFLSKGKNTMGLYPQTMSNRGDKVEVLAAPILDYVTGALAATDTYSTVFEMYGPGKAMLGLTGTWSGVATLQWTPYPFLSSTSPATWFTYATFSINDSQLIELATTCGVRIGLTAHASGTVTYWLGQGM